MDGSGGHVSPDSFDILSLVAPSSFPELGRFSCLGSCVSLGSASLYTLISLIAVVALLALIFCLFLRLIALVAILALINL